jgi:hypothetical protein
LSTPILTISPEIAPHVDDRLSARRLLKAGCFEALPEDLRRLLRLAAGREAETLAARESREAAAARRQVNVSDHAPR